MKRKICESIKRTMFLLLVLMTCEGTMFGKVKIGDLYYNLNKKAKTAEVTYKSYNKDLMAFNAGWDITDVVIPVTVSYKNTVYTVRRIGESAFQDCISLKTVTISYNVREIGDKAFYSCTDLRTVTIPNSIIHIGEAAFAECKSLTSLDLPNSVTSIGNSAFNKCASLTKLRLGTSVTSIGSMAFADCSSLTSVIIPRSVITIGDLVFYNCHSLNSVTIERGVTSLGERMFDNCFKLTTVSLPNTLTTIGAGAFQRCNALPVIDIPNSVKTIGASAFQYCYALQSIVIPDAVTKIEYATFQFCGAMKSISLGNGVTSIGKRAFSNCLGLTYVEIPQNVTTLEEKAFYSCKNLRIVVLPNTIKSIGDEAFAYCPDLTIGTFSSRSIPDFPSDHVLVIRSEDRQYYQPFSVYAKDFVQRGINWWQQKGEYEKTIDWQKRVNEQTRQQKIEELLKEAEKKYLTYWQPKMQPKLEIGKYDADNEVYAMKDSQFGMIYMVVPLGEAKAFHENWYKKQQTYQLQLSDDELKLATLSLTMPNGKIYTYRNTDAFNYNLADIKYNFAPIELNLGTTEASGRQNITKSKTAVVKSSVDTDIPESKAHNPNTFVVIFANEDYKNVAAVPYAKNDGTIFQKYCQKTLGIPHTNIHYVENASYNDIRLELAWLKNVCEKYEGDASVIVYYAGHGIPDASDKSSYLLPVDGDGRYVATGYKLDELYQKLGDMPTKSIVVLLDACFSGANRDGKMLASERGVALKSRPGQPQGNMIVFSAAKSDETALPNNDERHGMFTYYLLKKLQETKGDVTLQDLSDYVIREVGRTSAVLNKPQTPSITPAVAVSDEWKSWKLK